MVAIKTNKYNPLDEFNVKPVVIELADRPTLFFCNGVHWVWGNWLLRPSRSG